MNDWTGAEMEVARRGLERASAEILGRMLFEFSRLDVALGLCLIWSGDGRQVEKLTKTVGEYSFHQKLEFLKELADGKFARDAEARSLYSRWLRDAHKTREMRNELIHGRWGTDPIKQQVVNVVGLPTSVDQREIRYTISDLERALLAMNELHLRLQTLRKQWTV